MLGCQDFCGYYDWTFAFIGRAWGRDALERFWAEAIGSDSQAHYERAAREGGLRGLLETWSRTGQDEQCDWTFTLDEARNTLRWDMRKCPSKGFLLAGDMNASEDYCDHCMGWIKPLLDRAGAEVAAHEHNHCGQCWAEISMKNRPRESLQLACDIRRDATWQRGYIDRWESGRKLPILSEISSSPDPCDVLDAWFRRTNCLVVSGMDPGKAAEDLPRDAVLLTGRSYATRDVHEGEPLGVLIEHHPDCLDQISRRFLTTPRDQRPLLMHAYLPELEQADFAAFNLPRPVPILPLLIRRGLYVHRPGKPYPSTGVFLILLAVALGKELDVAGIDHFGPSDGKAFPGIGAEAFTLPGRHNRDCDLEHLRSAVQKAATRIRLPAHLHTLLERAER